MSNVYARRNHFFALFAAVFLTVSNLSAQQQSGQDSTINAIFAQRVPTTIGSQTRYGVFLSGLYNMHNAQFVPPAPSCCKSIYGTQSSVNGGFGALGEYPFFVSQDLTLGLSGRVGLQFEGAAFNRDTVRLIGIESVRNSFPFSANLNRGMFELSGLARLLENRLIFYAGAGAGLYINPTMSFGDVVSSEFEKVDSVLVPAALTVNNAAIPGANGVRFSAQGGLAYEFPLNPEGTTLLALEGWFQYNLNPITTELKLPSGGAGLWTLNTVRLGLSLRFAPERTTPSTLDEIRQKADSILRERNARLAKLQREKDYRDSILKEAVLAKIVDIKGVKPDGTTQDTTFVRVKEFRTAVSHYLLNSIFFGEKSSVIPQQYLRVNISNANTFSLDNLKTLTDIDIYKHILAIVGRRMRENPRAVLRIVAYADSFSENSNSRLAEERALAVQRYFEKVWGIGSDRMNLQGSSHAPIAGVTKSASLHAQEQRRVDLFSTTPEILDEITFETVQREVHPSALRINADMYAGAGLKQWQIEASQFNNREDKLLWTQQGFTPEQKRVLTWNLETTHTDSLPETNEPINFRLSIADQTGKPDESKLYTVPAEIKRVGAGGDDTERIETFTIFPFNYGTSLPADDAALRHKIESIRARLEPNSKVEIIGYTDTRGDESNNYDLSEERARAISSLLNAPNVSIKAGGESSRYENSTPDGRFYNRYVKVIVRTPTNK